MSNPKVSASINQWTVEFDPYGFAEDENWLEKADKVKDILRVEHVYVNGPILDVGYCGGKYIGVVISENDWENPLESVESKLPKEVSDRIYEWLIQYANGA